MHMCGMIVVKKLFNKCIAIGQTFNLNLGSFFMIKKVNSVANHNLLSVKTFKYLFSGTF